MNEVIGPKKLYHYTRLQVLVDILLKEELWLTDCRFLNDKKEFFFAGELVSNTLNKFNFNDKEQKLNQASPSHKARNENFINQFKLNFLRYTFLEVPQYQFQPYVFSLTETRDSLSQWRAYGNGEVCIEFDMSTLRSLFGSTIIFPVVYRQETDIFEDLLTEIDKFFDDKIRFLKTNGYLDTETILEGSRDLSHFVQKNINPVRYKHSGFKEECEWRISSAYRPGVGNNLFFSPGRYPVPRSIISLKKEGIHIGDVLTGILFGPGSDEFLCKSLLSDLNLRVGTRYEACFSNVPFRK